MDTYFYYSGIILNILVPIGIILLIMAYPPKRLRIFIVNVLTILKPLWCKNLPERLNHLISMKESNNIKPENKLIFDWWIWVLTKRNKSKQD